MKENKVINELKEQLSESILESIEQSEWFDIASAKRAVDNYDGQAMLGSRHSQLLIHTHLDDACEYAITTNIEELFLAEAEMQKHEAEWILRRLKLVTSKIEKLIAEDNF